MLFDNFAFCGRHVHEFGCDYVEGATRIMRGRVARNEYAIGGESGTALYSGERYEAYTRSGILYPRDEGLIVADRPDMLRALTAWLTQGRGELIYDRDPAVFYLAQIDEVIEHTWEAWINGAVRVTMTLQPFAYSVQETTASVQAGVSASLQLNLETGVPAPLRVTITPGAGARLTGATISAGERRIVLDGLSVAAGTALTIDCARPILAAAGGVSVMSALTHFERLTLPGPGAVDVQLRYGTGGSALVQAAVRGRFA